MTREDAARVVSYLNAGFPREALEPESFAVWVTDMALLADPAVAVKAAEQAVRNADTFPTIHQFRQAYRAVKEASLPRQIEGPKPQPRTRPEWVNVYCWARRDRGEQRWFPQQREHGDLTRPSMTARDYELLLADWTAAGSPIVAAPQSVKVGL